MIADIIRRIEIEISEAFGVLYTWFSLSDVLMNYVPEDNGWSIKQNLEHVSLTNHYLLILIRKGTIKAVEKSLKNNHADLLQGYDIDWDKLEAIGRNKSFVWARPEHMEPTGEVALGDVLDKLKLQQSECLEHLHKLRNGEGILYKTMMSVNGLGKIDVYHYIIFLVRHIQRHIGQMQKIKEEFDKHQRACMLMLLERSCLT